MFTIGEHLSSVILVAVLATFASAGDRVDTADMKITEDSRLEGACKGQNRDVSLNLVLSLLCLVPPLECSRFARQFQTELLESRPALAESAESAGET